MSFAVLVCDPSYEKSKEVVSYFRCQGIVAEMAMNGRDCQLKLFQRNYFAIILDINTVNHAGFEVLKFLKLNTPYLKVILTVESIDMLNSLELSKNDLLDLGANNIFIKPYSVEIIKEYLEELKENKLYLENVTHDDEPIVLGSQEIDDNEFLKMKVSDLAVASRCVFDLYARIGKDKYLKVLSRGDSFKVDEMKKLKGTSAKYVYYKALDQVRYENAINEALERMLDLRMDRLVEKKKENRVAKFIDDMYTDNLRREVRDDGLKICQSVYTMVLKDPQLSSLLESYEQACPEKFSKIFLIAFFCALTCRELDWITERTMGIVLFGSLLHDIGILKLPDHLHNISPDDLTEDEFELYMSHPLKGAVMLESCELISEPIRQIVYQHHEYENGQGFPNGLKGHCIYPPAKVVSFVNEFVDILMKREITPKEALAEMIQDKELCSRYDIKVIKALISSLMKVKQKESVS